MYSWAFGEQAFCLDIHQVLTIADSKLNQSYFVDVLEGGWTGDDQMLDKSEMERLLYALDMVAEPAFDYSIEDFADMLSRYDMLRLMSFAYSDRILICIMRALFDVLGVSAGNAGSAGVLGDVSPESCRPSGSGSPTIASLGSSGSLKSCCASPVSLF
jgi:hypothetical protein